MLSNILLEAIGSVEPVEEGMFGSTADLDELLSISEPGGAKEAKFAIGQRVRSGETH